jgi:hypothetical protein
MTLGEVLQRTRVKPEKGAHEIVVGPDGLAHLLIVTHVGDDPNEISFMCQCTALNGMAGHVNNLEVAKDISCLMCIQWGA